MECKKCGSDLIEIQWRGTKPAHTCMGCGAFIKWAKQNEVEQEPCEYCSEDYVIPRVFDDGITAWENIDAQYCPICGLKRGE